LAAEASEIAGKRRSRLLATSQNRSHTPDSWTGCVRPKLNVMIPGYIQEMKAAISVPDDTSDPN